MKIIVSRLKTVFIMTGFAAVAMTSANAQTVTLPVSPGNVSAEANSTPVHGPWQVDIASYAWAPAINGTINLRGVSAPANARFQQIIDKSDSLFSYMSHIEVHDENFGAFFEPIYIDLGFKAPKNVFNSDIKTSLLYLQFGGFYRLAKGTYGAPEEHKGWSIDVVGAARYTQIDVSATFANSGFSPSGGIHWAEPLIGLRGSINLSPSIEFSARGDIGGFGLGSQFAWDAQALLGYKFDLFGRAATVFGGWKALAQDYKTGSGKDQFRWNTTLNGPVLGLNVHF